MVSIVGMKAAVAIDVQYSGLYKRAQLIITLVKLLDQTVQENRHLVNWQNY